MKMSKGPTVYIWAPPGLIEPLTNITYMNDPRNAVKRVCYENTK